MTCEYSGIFKYLYDWQSLIAGLIALIAAYVAARPVWRQLMLSARDTLIGRVAAIESKQVTTRELMTNVINAFMSQLRPYGKGQEPVPHPEWALAAQSTVGQVVTTLTANQESSLDGELIDNKRKAAISAWKALLGCLYDIHAPDTVDFGGPDAPTEQEQPAFEERGRRAAKELKNRISAATEAAHELDAAFLAVLKQLRQRIKTIDRQVGA